MSQATLRLLQVKFQGNGPCGGAPVEFRFGGTSIGSVVISQPNQYVSFPPSAHNTINGANAIRAYQNGILQGTFSPGISASTQQTNVLRLATTGCFGPGKFHIRFNVIPL